MPPKGHPDSNVRESSSSDEEYETSSGGEDGELPKSLGSESESEGKISPPLRKKASVPKRPETRKTHYSSSDAGSGSESPPGLDPKIKSIASKPMEAPPAKAATKKPRSKIISSPPAAKLPPVAGKRHSEAENITNRDVKRAKKKASIVDEETTKKAGDDSNKKQAFPRMWSEDDEIAILTGMTEYTSKTGVDAWVDMNGFHEFVKKSLNVDVTKTQLYEKVRRLRKKYENNVGKGKEGEDPEFSKLHEQKTYELSKKIWGNSGDNGLGNVNTKVRVSLRRNRTQRDGVASPSKLEKIEADKLETDTEVEPNAEKLETKSEVRSIGFHGRIGGLDMDENILKDGFELISDSNKAVLEGKWKKLTVEEMELYLKKVDLTREQTILILEALKSSED